MIRKSVRLLSTVAALAIAPAAWSQSPPAPLNMQDAAKNAAADAASDRQDAERFAQEARLQRDLGATQMNITKGLPIARFELDRDDPYPGWFTHHMGLFKVFPPAALQPHMDMAYVKRLQRVVGTRCQAIAAGGMTAVWTANEPAVLPEAFFVAHPEYRGPRIDQVARSRKIYFAPNVDHPDVQAMYRESVTSLMKLCPQIETFIWVTTDAGSGFAWNPGLYPGANGPAEGANKPLADRVVGFMTNIQQAASTAGGHPVRININQIELRRWMLPTFGPDTEANIVRQLPPGLAVNGKEGPDGRRFETGAIRPSDGPFSPIVGLVVPSFAPVKPPGQRRGFDLGTPEAAQFNYRLAKAVSGQPMDDRLKRLTALRQFAVSEVGEAQASNLIEAWQALDQVALLMQPLDFGGMLKFGHVLNRWLERPMVPYPAELTDVEKLAWRPYLFQARGEDQAGNLADIQAMDMYKGWGARLLFQQTIDTAMPQAEKAKALFDQIAASRPDAASRAEWELNAKRAQALIYLLRSADNMVEYQAQLDRVTAIAAKPEAAPVLGVQADWARADLMNLARSEIDTAVAMEKLLGSTDGRILDTASTTTEEYALRLGPNVRENLRQKIRIMNAHWRDYDRMFTVPNP